MTLKIGDAQSANINPTKTLEKSENEKLQSNTAAENEAAIAFLTNNNPATRVDNPSSDSGDKKTVGDFLQKALQQQPINVNDENADKVQLTMKVGKSPQAMSREDYNVAFRRAVYDKAMDGLKLSDEEIKLADQALIAANLYKSYYNLQGALDKLQANQQKSGQEMPIAVGRENIEYARRAGQAVLQYRESKAKESDLQKQLAESRTNQMLLDPLRLGGNTPVRWAERLLNTPKDLLQQIDRGEIAPGSAVAKKIGRQIGEQITGQPAPEIPTASEFLKQNTGIELPSIPDIEVPRPFEYQSEKYKTDGKTGEEIGATAIDLLLLKRGITNSRINSPQSLKELVGLPQIEAVNSVLNTSKATVDIRKFSEYIFKPDATHGKDIIFRKLGYSQKDSAKLAEILQKQASEKLTKGEYVLGKKNEYGQRIDIEIKLEGIGQAKGKTSYLKSGWMIRGDGTISLNTPFSGFTR